MTYSAKIIPGGKIVIPAELRRELGMNVGDRLVIERDGDSLIVKTYMQLIREGQDAFRSVVGEDYSVDQFLAERKLDWGHDS